MNKDRIYLKIFNGEVEFEDNLKFSLLVYYQIN